MSAGPAKGTALRTHHVVVRFVPGLRPGPRPPSFNVVELRKLLRTEMSLREIAMQLGVKEPALRAFIKQRNLCNLTDRKNFISRQASLNLPDLPSE